MFALGLLVPILIVGAIVWGAIGISRNRGAQPFTIATATSFYAHVGVLVSSAIFLAGAAFAVKVGLGHLDPNYSYQIAAYGGPKGPGASYYSGPTVDQLLAQDVILAVTMLVVGALSAIGHAVLARAVSGRPGGSPSWVIRGSLVVATAGYGAAGISAGLAGLYSALTYFWVPAASHQPFGDAVGMAVAFVPAWLLVMAALVRTGRTGVPRAAVSGAHATT